jgi:hypothetical protein
MPAGTEAEASDDVDEGYYEGGTSNVESPAGHGGALSVVQLREVLQVSEVWLMES